MGHEIGRRVSLVIRTVAAALSVSFAACLVPYLARESDARDANRRFEFVVMGDIPYVRQGRLLWDEFLSLRDAIAKLSPKPAFSIHLGDIGDVGQCHHEYRTRVFKVFENFPSPLIYAVGDNEWFDCGQDLMSLREIFFPTSRGDKSLGQRPVRVERQSSLPGTSYHEFVENVRFRYKDVYFVVVNIPGVFDPVGQFTKAIPDRIKSAAQDWIANSIKKTRSGDKGLVIAFHAVTQATSKISFNSNACTEDYDVRGDVPSDAAPKSRTWVVGDTYRTILKQIRDGAASFGRPVLVLQGDFHSLVVDCLLDGENPVEAMDKVIRLQVMGGSATQAVRVLVDPSSDAVFSFAPLLVRKNMLMDRQAVGRFP